MANKITLSFTVDEVTGEANTTIQGTTLDLMVALIELSKQLLAQVEEKGGEHFAKGFYATAQQHIIEGSCLKKSYDEHTKQFERIRPLMDILGKTFEMPEKKEDVE